MSVVHGAVVVVLKKSPHLPLYVLVHLTKQMSAVSEYVLSVNSHLSALCAADILRQCPSDYSYRHILYYITYLFIIDCPNNLNARRWILQFKYMYMQDTPDNIVSRIKHVIL